MSEQVVEQAGLGAGQGFRAGIREFQQANHGALCRSRERNGYFHRYMAKVVGGHVVAGARVLDVGCATGDMLAALKPGVGVGIDINGLAIADARKRHPDLIFHEMAAEDLRQLAGETFDYVVLSGVLPQLYDLHTALEALRGVCHERTRVIVCTFSRVWQPIIRLGETMGRKLRVPDESWIPSSEVSNILGQCDFEVVRQETSLMMPVGVPVVADLLNRWVAPLPGVNKLMMCTVTVGRMLARRNTAAGVKSVSVVVPARNEAGNIRPLLSRIPQMAERQEVLFIEGNSKDNTWETIQEVVKEYAGPMEVKCMKQTGKGKGDAVRAAFAAATGDILLILDADISVPPEELARFVELVARGRCDFANGSRLVYPMEKHAMQFLNMIANTCFGWMFTYLLGQRIRDTLCGTKVLWAEDYKRIAANRAYFGDFDPFGDFDLLFGAARLNLKIMDVPVHYKQRTYGETNISRFSHGWLLLKMCGVAARKIKFL